MNNRLVLGVGLTIVVLFILQVQFNIIGLTIGVVASGFTTLSLSEATFSSSNQFFTGNVFALTVAQGGLGQSASGVISAEDINSESGVFPENDFTLSIDYSEQSCEYPFIVEPNAQKIATYNLINYDGDFLCDDQNRIIAECPNGLVAGSYDLFNCWCIEETVRTGAISPFIENPLVRTKSKISVSNGVLTESADFDTSGQINGFIGANVYAQWNGNLMVDRCLSQSQYYGFYSSNLFGSSWRTGLKVNYDNYIIERVEKLGAGRIANCQTFGIVENKECLNNLVNDVNIASNIAMDNVAFGSIRDSSSVTNAIIEVALPSAVQVPVYTFYVKADYLGIVQPVAKPKIISVNSETFKAGEVGEIQTIVSNVGNEAGNINVWASCNSPFRYTESTKTYTLNVNEQRTVYLKISADTEEPVTGVCTVHASSLDITASKTVSVSVDPHTICTPNQEACSENNRLTCNEFGTGWEFTENCLTQGEVCHYVSSTSTECTSESTTPPSDDGFNLFKIIGDFFMGIVDFIGGLFGGGIVGNFVGLLVTIIILLITLWLILRKIFGG